MTTDKEIHTCDICEMRYNTPTESERCYNKHTKEMLKEMSPRFKGEFATISFHEQERRRKLIKELVQELRKRNPYHATAKKHNQNKCVGYNTACDELEKMERE